MLKLSGLLGILLLCIGVNWFKFYGTDIIQVFIILQAYIIFTLFYLFKLSTELIVKALCLYIGIFWCISFITDLFLIDLSLILTIIGALFIYPISAKKLIKTECKPNLKFNTNYVLHIKPFKWYHWIWLLVGKDMDAYRTYYNSSKQVYIRMENGILIERKVDRETILREISALNADVSKAEVSYAELHNKLGTKINCKRKIY